MQGRFIATLLKHFCGSGGELFALYSPEGMYSWHLDSSVRTCNRACSIPLIYACSLIKYFIFQGYAAKVRWRLSGWRFKHLWVLWLAGPLESVSESNSEDEEGMVVRGTLLDLRKCVESPGFILQCKAAFPYFTLLDAVITYLYHPMPCPPRCLPEDCPIIMLAGLNASSAARSGVTTTSDVYAAACVHCRESAHMPFTDFPIRQRRKGCCMAAALYYVVRCKCWVR